MQLAVYACMLLSSWVACFLLLVTQDPAAEQLIPRSIHQIWTGPDPIPSVFFNVTAAFRASNPEYTYVLWTDVEIDKYLNGREGELSEEIRKAYRKINPKYGAARADFFRYVIIYDQGGVYFDVKSRPTKPLREIITPEDEFLLSCWDEKDWKTFVPPIDKFRNATYIHEFWSYDREFGEYQQWHVIARPKHPFLRAVIEEVLEKVNSYRIASHTDVGNVGVLRTTGPCPYTRAIHAIKKYHNHTFKASNYDHQFRLSPFESIFQHVKLQGKKHYSRLRKPIVLFDAEFKSQERERSEGHMQNVSLL